MPGEHGQGCGCREESETVGGTDLLSYINTEGIHALNELNFGSCKQLFRLYSDRLNEDFFCESQEDDPELMLFIPFSTPCSISSITIIGGDNGTSPSRVKVYINNENIDFSTVDELEPAQSLDLIEDFCGAFEYNLRANKFKNVSYIVLYFPSSINSDQTKIYYIQLKGYATNYQRKAVTAVYESKPNVSDHKNSLESPNLFGLK
ncbi:hypothetical protein FG386_003428 [Cryptosporidium ryanae]|uniref:uncharacterized protein n=1 Tax=Cryptosporidium ryanae TaxID=515981 RepID=UPI00351A4725|nr:hypothetical protein FG386_003428 [Cryptosporidium ryanae]